MVRNQGIQFLKRAAARGAIRGDLFRKGPGIGKCRFDQEHRQAKQLSRFPRIAPAVLNGFHGQPDRQAHPAHVGHPARRGLAEFDSGVVCPANTLGNEIGAQRGGRGPKTPRDLRQLLFHVFRDPQGNRLGCHTMYTLTPL